MNIGNRQLRIAAALSTALLAGFCSAGEWVELWSAPDLDGWEGGGGEVILGSSSENLTLIFAKQKAPVPAECLVYAGTNAAMGAFAGDFVARGVTSMAFRFLAQNQAPSILQLRLRSTSGREWSMPFAPVPVGQWQEYQATMEYSAGWRCLGGSEQIFRDDLRNVLWSGLYILRKAGAESVVFQVDDFKIVYEDPVEMSGNACYGGEQAGPIVVFAAANSNAWSGAQSVALPVPGEYVLTNISPRGVYWLKAYQDSNENHSNDFWEACGEWDGNPACLEGVDLKNINIYLYDPVGPNGLPYWWGYKNFDMSLSELATQTVALVEADTDGDGMDNWAEYRAGTDPNDSSSQFVIQSETPQEAEGIILTWPSISLRTYAILRCTDLQAGFTILEPVIFATPPLNTYNDVTATGPGPYFYKVLVNE